MSVSIRTINHGMVENCGFNGPDTSVVRIGEYEIPLDEFCSFAAYVLNGGLFGWQEHIPECVQKAVQTIKS